MGVLVAMGVSRVLGVMVVMVLMVWGGVLMVVPGVRGRIRVRPGLVVSGVRPV
ncbi:hypothetical protein MU0083_003616 [[Mycobacterium] kokjensenii]|uniref:Uncharacterized protein n=1 Tax=[Mycobacterium] kokjensenii TaxID=3064287 RepID=A0ABN9NIE3_9MYCO|nr:hypothetical protein [Mycolicibacter sp. MU0083]CAJ1505144.1 hypothetical protein MU0083_003616 [Mycolicibacter sp. MU0083]